MESDEICRDLGSEERGELPPEAAGIGSEGREAVGPVAFPGFKDVTGLGIEKFVLSQFELWQHQVGVGIVGVCHAVRFGISNGQFAVCGIVNEGRVMEVIIDPARDL